MTHNKYLHYQKQYLHKLTVPGVSSFLGGHFRDFLCMYALHQHLTVKNSHSIKGNSFSLLFLLNTTSMQQSTNIHTVISWI